MKIKYIKALNFMSYPEIEIYFDDLSGLIQIHGVNYDDDSESGVGKSTIPDLISFWLTGDCPRDLKVNEFINDSVGKGLVVEGLIKADVDIFIKRTRKPEDLYYCVNGSDPYRGSNIKETQSIIEELTNIDFNLFVNSIYFSRANDKKIITASDTVKREMFTRFLDASDFDLAYEKTSQKIKSIGEKISGINIEIDKKEALVSEIEEGLDRDRLNSSNFDKDKENEVLKIDERIKRSKHNINKYEMDISKVREQSDKDNTPEEPDVSEIEKEISSLRSIKYDDFSSRIDKYKEILSNEERDREAFDKIRRKISELEYTKDNINKEIKEIQSSEGFCHKCRQSVSKEHINKEIERLTKDNESLFEEFSKYQDYYGKMKARIESHTSNRNELNDLIKRQNDIELEEERNRSKIVKLVNKRDGILGDYKIACSKAANMNDTIQKEIESINKIIDEERKNIKSFEEDMESVKQKKNPYIKEIELKTKKIDSLKLEVSDLLKERDKISDIQQLMETLKKSYKNVKYFLFESTINELNTRIQKYLDPLFNEDVKVEFIYKSGKDRSKLKFDVLIEKNGIEKSFKSLSDGEKKRVELATNFALSDIVLLRKRNSLSLMILDEMFDGLPESVRERVVDLLNVLRKDRETILIIDHFKAMSNMIDNEIVVEKRNGKSKIRR